jgi:hypothetical protein
MSQADPPKDILDDYLKGGTPLSRAYGQSRQEEPPASLDETILAASRRSVKARPKIAWSPFSSSWMLPVSVAAVVLVSATVALLMKDELRQDTTLYAPVIPPVVEEKSRAAPTPMPVPEAGGGTDSASTSSPRQPPAALTSPSAKTEGAHARQEARPAGPAAGPSAPAAEAPAPTLPAPPPATPGAPEEASAGGQTAPQAKSVADSIAAPAREATTSSEVGSARAKPRMQMMPESAVRTPANVPMEEDPAKWLAHITQLREQGKLAEASASLAAFKQRYPDYPIPPALR